jgi:hypothetical protein
MSYRFEESFPAGPGRPGLRWKGNIKMFLQETELTFV